MAYGEKAMYRDAIEALQKAATLAADNPVILGELGRIYAA
jgi:cytochrome c-type biogenesis protein CcmH/NrfG